MAAIIESRQKRIEDDLADASRLKGESDAAVAAYEKALADARNRAQAIATETREQQAAEAEARRKTLESELNTKLAEAEKTIAATKQAAMGNVRGIAEDATRAIVERLIGEAPNEKTRRGRGRRRAERLVAMLMEAETWVALAFVLFVGLLGYLGVHRMITKSLDDRAARIKAELDEARKLKDEAAELLAEYQRKRQAAEGEAQDIISGAKAEAERMAAEAKTRIEDFVARRTKMAETKIAQAEAQAAADVRSAAAEAAIAAAEKILSAETKGKLAGDLIAKGIEDVRKKLN